MNDALAEAAANVGAAYGMTPDQVLAYIALGDRRHADAPEDDCGVVDPRNDAERHWCRHQPGHPGDHCRYPPALCGVTP